MDHTYQRSDRGRSLGNRVGSSFRLLLRSMRGAELTVVFHSSCSSSPYFPLWPFSAVWAPDVRKITAGHYVMYCEHRIRTVCHTVVDAPTHSEDHFYP